MHCSSALYSVLLLNVLFFTIVSGAPPLATGDRRIKREFDVTLDTSFEVAIGADIKAALEGTLWRNEAGTAHLGGTASYSQHIDNGGNAGNGKVVATIRYHHD